MTFTEKYSKILDIVRDDIEKIDLLDSIDIQEPLRSELCAILNAPSKHIRAFVSFLYLKASGCEINEKQVEYQTAIELVHNASLIHDDVIDNSAKRRNCKTLNNTFDSKLAVIAGDYLLAAAMKKVINIGIPKLVDMFCETLKNMTFGEINQYFDKFKVPRIEKYIEKSEQKTAKLFETAMAGAILIAAKESSLIREDTGGYQAKQYTTNFSPVIEGVKIFAKNFGIAFQIRDDLINCLTSKSDIKDGIYTAPVIFSERNDEYVTDVNITDTGIEKTKILLNNYLNTARDSLQNIEDNRYKLALSELVELFRNE